MKNTLRLILIYIILDITVGYVVVTLGAKGILVVLASIITAILLMPILFIKIKN